MSVALSEAEVHWRAFLDSLIGRGLRGVKYIASDDHAGLKAARKAMFPGVPWQRCQFHLQHNAQGYVTKLDQRKAGRTTPDADHHLLDELLWAVAPIGARWWQIPALHGLFEAMPSSMRLSSANPPQAVTSREVNFRSNGVSEGIGSSKRYRYR